MSVEADYEADLADQYEQWAYEEHQRLVEASERVDDVLTDAERKALAGLPPAERQRCLEPMEQAFLVADAVDSRIQDAGPLGLESTGLRRQTRLRLQRISERRELKPTEKAEWVALDREVLQQEGLTR